MGDVLLAGVMALPLVAYFLCGLLAALLQPRNAAARRLLLAGILLPGSRVLEHLVLDRPADAAELGPGWLLRWLAETSFLLGLAALVAALAVFPDGQYAGERGRLVARVIVGAAVLSSIAVLVGAPTLSVGGQSPVDNPLDEPALRALGTVGSVIAATEPLWALTGVVLLFRRRRTASAAVRAELRWPLWSLGAFAATLVLAIAVNGISKALGGSEIAVVQPVFLVALALFPIGLVIGIARRGRRIEHELSESRRRLVQAEDVARRKLERDLHDGAQQQLVGVLSLLQLAQRQQARQDPQAVGTLREATAETQRAMQDLRAIVSGIHPSVLTDRGLVEAIDSRLSVLPAQANLTAEPAAAARRWPPAVEAAAYFIACEALSNAAKHARAGALDVQVSSDGNDLHLVVADDGVGFDVSSTGLRGIAGAVDRAEALGGRLDVRSTPGVGTVVELRLPGSSS